MVPLVPLRPLVPIVPLALIAYLVVAPIALVDHDLSHRRAAADVPIVVAAIPVEHDHLPESVAAPIAERVTMTNVDTLHHDDPGREPAIYHRPAVGGVPVA